MTRPAVVRKFDSPRFSSSRPARTLMLGLLLAFIVPGRPCRAQDSRRTAYVTVVDNSDLTPLAHAELSFDGRTNYTDDHGLAVLHTTDDNVRVKVSKRDWAPMQFAWPGKPGETNRFQIKLIAFPHLSGIVRDVAGKPVADALVTFYPGYHPNAYLRNEVRTDQSGRYRLVLQPRHDSTWTGYSTWTNLVMVRSLDRNLAATSEFQFPPTNLDFTLSPGVTLTGSVRDSNGHAITNATVNMCFYMQFVCPLFEKPVPVDGRGMFSIPALPQSRDYICFQGVTADGYAPASGQVAAALTATNHYEFPPFVLRSRAQP